MLNEADTCRLYITPALVSAGWDDTPHSINEQYTFTAGRIVVVGETVTRKKKQRADYLLRYTRDFPIAVVEAKPYDDPVGTGFQQAKAYAETLGLSFAYATNGQEILEFDYLTGLEKRLDRYPTPDELWQRLRGAQGLSEETSKKLLSPAYHESGKSPRYYQEIAINRTVQAIWRGQSRILLTMATGTGKTVVAFQIAYKLWIARWNRAGKPNRQPRILFLADRNVLVDDPKDKTFAPFANARWKIQNGNAIKSRQMYFSTYQAIARDERRPGLYREYAPDFFDLIIVDEAHRGSSSDDSNWREILEYFAPAVQLGMTATPLREDNRDTYRYFGKPIYEYSLRQGIEDGFLAPYKVHRVITTWDATGWRPSIGQQDRYGEDIPDDEYHTKDFERLISLTERTNVIAQHLTTFLKQTDRFAKTIVFCVDQEHADQMRRALANLNSDLVREHPDYVARVTSDEKEIGRGHLSNFQDPEMLTPAILTTSQMLTTGVDAPTCKVVALVRDIGSMTEFKQIIGRGTRVRDDYGKFYFHIVDYTGAATRKFADPDFDGLPVTADVVEVDNEGNAVVVVPDPEIAQEEQPDGEILNPVTTDVKESDDQYDSPMPDRRPRKFYVDGGQVEIVVDVVYELDPDGKQLRAVKYTDWASEKIRTLYPTAGDLQAKWADLVQRQEIIKQLEDRGISFDHLAAAAKQPDADPFDLLCHLAFDAPLRTRRERAERLRKEQQDFFDQYGPEARAILNALLDKYATYGPDEMTIPDALKVAPVSQYGTVAEMINYFGGAEQLKQAVADLQQRLYSAA